MRIRDLLLLGLLIVAAKANAFPLTPNLELTPGQRCTTKDRDFSRFRYRERIAYCRREVSRDLKHAVYQAYGIPPKCRSRYTVDHLIPLSMGGNNSFENLWPEHRRVKATREDLELEIFEQLRDGFLTQNEAIEIVLENKFNPARPKEGRSPCDQIDSPIQQKR